MNANRAIRFRQDFRFTCKTGVDYLRICCSMFIMEIAMTWFAVSGRLSHVALVVATATSLFFADAALAAQGPGTGAGTASSLTQLAMAVMVYGMSALVVTAGLIGAVRGAKRSLPASNQKYRKQPHAK
jgi:hypothetical protein